MGGGKSHGLIGLWHLAAHPQALGGTDIGRDAFARAAGILDEKLPADLNNPVVVVLACDNMTAGKGAAEFDGPAQTLHERFLWRLFQGDNNLYLRYRDGYADKHRIVEALTAVGRPVLILVDEILDYVRQLSLSGNADLAIKDMAFLRALLDSVNDVPNVAAVVVMIASEADNIDLDDAGQKRRQELDDLLIRNGETATINDNTDFAAILRRPAVRRPRSGGGTQGHRRRIHVEDDWTVEGQGLRRRPRDRVTGFCGRGRALLPVPPAAHGSGGAGVGQACRLPAGPVDHPHLRGHGARPVPAREAWRVGPVARRPG